MAETKETLDGNWYKAAMGLRYTKEGLQQFVTDEIDKFHKNILQNFSQNDQCNTCTIQNVLPCPTPGICGRPCNFHDYTDPTKRYTRCPKNICGVIRDKVKDSHRYGRPTFKNSDPQVWFNNSWELAKCFMPPGYSDSTTADDTDFSGLINVILCHLDFQAFTTENLKQDGNKFKKALNARNAIMHSPKMELSTSVMNHYYQLLTDVLSDKKHLQALPKAQEAIKKLTELQQRLITDKEMIRKEYHQMIKGYNESKTNLQKELIDHYFQNDYCKSAIPALIDDEEVDVADIFDMPKMRIKQSSSKDIGSQKAEYRYIENICEIFQTDKGQSILRACISGEAGYGKTTLCQKILSNWCKLHTNQETESLQSDDKTFLKSFDFLFYIPLRNHTTSDTTDMIKAELVRRDMHDILDEVLRRDSCKCFIILEGLDEWLPPETCDKKIPNFDRREKMTVLITSRPWKLEVLRLKDREIGHQVELCGVTDENKCVMAVVDYLNKIWGGKKTLWDISKEEKFRHVRHLMHVPALLTQFVCMWYDDMDFGKTRVDVYCRMIEYYLQMDNKRQKHTTKQNSYEFSRSKSRTTENDCLPDIFRDLPFCQKYSDLLSRLSHLAFQTLFSEKKENSLVFTHSLTEISVYGLNEVDLTFCLKAGLLSQARFRSKVTLQTKKISFIHKTVQEFLAAVHIANNDSEFKDILPKLSCFKDVFEMGECLRFLCGLRPDLIYDISNHIAVLTDKDETVISYRKSIDYSHKTYLLERIQHLIYEIVEEGCRCNKGEMVNKVIIRDIHFSRHVQGKEKIYEHIKEDEIKSFVMTYNYFEVCLKRNKFTQLRLLRTKFHKANLCKISFVIDTQADFDYLMDMLQNSMTSLNSLGIFERLEHDIYVDYQSFFSILMDTTCLTGISLRKIRLDHSCIEQMAQFLSSRTQFEEIQLSYISCVTCRRICAPCKYRIDFSNHQKLHRLDIVELSGQVTLCDGLPLQYCKVEACECGPSVIACLESSDSLQKLNVEGLFIVHQIHRYTTRENDDSEASPSSSGLSTILVRVIPTLRNLKKLNLRHIDFGQNLLRLSSDMKYLIYVNLFCCTQTEESFKCFIDSLPETQSVLNVYLSYSTIIQKNSDLSRIEENYLSQKYHKSHGRRVKNFSNDKHAITLSSW